MRINPPTKPTQQERVRRVKIAQQHHCACARWVAVRAAAGLHRVHGARNLMLKSTTLCWDTLRYSGGQ